MQVTQTITTTITILSSFMIF